jgi:hypothetical protein
MIRERERKREKKKKTSLLLKSVLCACFFV